MADQPFGHEETRTIRAHWFDYLDAVEPLRGELHAYCHRLTGNIWDAEDLVQDTLLKGFGMAARGDFHGENSPVRNVKAYLFRTATNAWLDIQRKPRKQVAAPAEREHTDTDPAEVGAAINKVVTLASPRELAAILLKDVYDFTLAEVAEFIGTTEGTVKSALSRGRRKMQETDAMYVSDPETKRLVRQFVDAINSQEVERVIDLMAETVQIKVCNVGGGRGRDGDWTSKSLVSVQSVYAECDGEPVVLMFREGDDRTLWDVLRLDGANGTVTRLVDYCYAPDTLHYVAGALGYACDARAYHQPREIIETEMVPTTRLPWAE